MEIVAVRAWRRPGSCHASRLSTLARAMVDSTAAQTRASNGEAAIHGGDEDFFDSTTDGSPTGADVPETRGNVTLFTR